MDGLERDFFRLVAKAAYLNPFSPERDAVDVRIAEVEGDDPELLPRLLYAIESRLAPMEERGELGPDTMAFEDWRLVEHAVLFETFHRYVGALDALIEAQIAAGSRPLAVPFAPDLLGRLRRRGVGAEKSLRMIALFWQLRRAYTFIVGGLSGVSPSMRRLREAIWNDVFTYDGERFERLLWNRLEDFSVILRGETGTGKGQAAAAIGRSGFVPYDERGCVFSTSFTDLIVNLNLSQFPESLIESELFGHKKGAFTGAVDNHQGAFDRCSPNGAIFLDEIGEVSIPVQIKLLRVLQDRVFTPVGSHEERRFDGRVIAATHRDLDEARRERRFRNDFYYRLCSDVIEVPPLRVRIAEDPRELGVLVTSLVDRIVGAPAPDVTGRVLEVIGESLPDDYAWPGNVRELEQCVRRVLLTDRFAADGSGAHRALGPVDRFLDQVRAGTLEARELAARYCAMLHERHGTYEEVSRITGLDRRTVRKYVEQVKAGDGILDADG
ncbi:MAG: sigma 54-interacting transcriptional regulator [Sandaracinaceae bacterium]